MSVDDATPSEDPSFSVSDKTYNTLRFVAVILLPGLGTLYFALAGLLNLPAAEQVVGTITAVDAFLGLLLRSLRVAYEKSDARFDGEIIVGPHPETGDKVMDVALDSEAIANKDEVVVKVRKEG